MKEKNTIIALSTTALKAAIAVIRLSGKDSLNIFNQISSKPLTKANFAEYAVVSTKTLKDDVIAIYFQAPKSYTGEDMVEINCHGNSIIIESILNELVSRGACPAQRGEFTLRAFENGKMDLTSAEAVVDIIDAQSTFEINNAFKSINGGFFKEIQALQNKLIDLLSSIEVAIDYPEEGVEECTKEQASAQLHEILKSCQEYKNAYTNTGKLKNGIKVVLHGETNVGKSSLLNALTSTERSIVTEVAGTTRDVVTESYEYNGVRFIIYDTAGIRDTEDKVERLGIERSLNALREADIALNISDGKIFQQINVTAPQIKVLNKALEDDCKKEIDCDIKVSAKYQINIDALKQLIYEKTVNRQENDAYVITNLRQYDCICAAYESLTRAKNALEDMPLDLITIDCNDAYRKLGEITGVTASDEIIGRIFERFCVGK